MSRYTAVDATKLLRAFGSLPRETEKQVQDAVVSSVLDIHGTARKLVQRGPKTGNVYRKSNPDRRHQASKGGEAPATDTGGLVNSLYFDVELLSGTVGSHLAYAAYLEHGTRQIEARPYLVPSVETNRTKVVKRIMKAIGVGTGRAAAKARR